MKRLGAIAALWVGIVGAVASSCGGQHAPEMTPLFVADASALGPVGAERRAIALPISLSTPHLVAVRCSIERGAVEVVVLKGERRVAERRVARYGENLGILVLGPDAGVDSTLVVAAASDGGPVVARVDDVRVFAVNSQNAAPTADALARAFEAETGRLANPAVENLVANPDFRADDEVRGTPADWFAYVETTFDEAAHELRVAGRSGPFRPLLATGPVRLEEGRRYRAVCRLTVDSGAARFRAVDYDELAELGTSHPVVPGDGPVVREVVFVAGPGSRAVRLVVDAVDREASQSLRVAGVQLEELPPSETAR